MLQSISTRITVSPVLVQLVQQAMAVPAPVPPAARPQRVSWKVGA